MRSLLVLGLLALALGGCAQSPYDWARAERAARIDAALEPLDLLLAAIWRAAPAVIIGIVIVLATRAVWLAIDRAHRERWPRAGDGALPVPADDLRDLAPATLAAYHAVRAIAAATQPPHTVHYAPRWTGAAPVAAADTAATAPSAGSPPTAQPLRDLVAAGWWPSPDRVLLGVGPSGLVTARLSGLLSTAVAGRPGTGKTALLRFVAWQVLALGGMVDIIDPHGDVADGMGTWGVRVATTGRDMETVMRDAIRRLDARLDAYRHGDRNHRPAVVIIDELPAIAATVPGVVDTIGRVVLEGRKIGMYAYIAGQGLPAAITGGRLVRDALASRYVFRTTPDEARRAGLPTDAARQVVGLPPGVAVMDGAAVPAPTVVAIPWTDPTDGVLLPAASLRGGTGAGTGAGSGAEVADATITTPPPSPPTGPLPAASHGDGSGAEATEAADADIVARFLRGETPASIAAALAGSRGGRAYQEAAQRVNDALRRALRARHTV